MIQFCCFIINHSSKVHSVRSTEILLNFGKQPSEKYPAKVGPIQKELVYSEHNPTSTMDLFETVMSSLPLQKASF